MENYKIHKIIGDGSFGIVYKATNIKTGEIVAIKKIKKKFSSWEECMSLRELKSLRKLNHPNIIKLKEAIKISDELHFVFEFLDQNLYQMYNQMRDSGKAFSENQIRSIIYQTTSALVYMHKHGFFHRDLKPENLLIHKEYVKIADFGLAREIRSRPPFTDYVATRWYRAPEILLKSTNYNSPVDIFALGCIMAELYTQSPLFRGNSEMDQIYKVCSILGTPTLTTWPEGFKLATQIGFNFPHFAPVPLGSLVPNACDDALQLIADMLRYDPQKRPSAQQILQHPYFMNYVHIERPLTPQISNEYLTGTQRELKNESPVKLRTKALEVGRKKSDFEPVETVPPKNSVILDTFNDPILDSLMNLEKVNRDYLPSMRVEKKPEYKGVPVGAVIEEEIAEQREERDDKDESINTQLLEQQINEVMEEYKPNLVLKPEVTKRNSNLNSIGIGSMNMGIDLVLPPQNNKQSGLFGGQAKIQAGHSKFLGNVNEGGYQSKKDSFGENLSTSFKHNPYDFSTSKNTSSFVGTNSNSNLYLPKQSHPGLTLPTHEGSYQTNRDLSISTNNKSNANLYNFSGNTGGYQPSLYSKSPSIGNKQLSFSHKNSIASNSSRMNDMSGHFGNGLNFESVFQEEVGGLGRYKF